LLVLHRIFILVNEKLNYFHNKVGSNMSLTWKKDFFFRQEIVETQSCEAKKPFFYIYDLFPKFSRLKSHFFFFYKNIYLFYISYLYLQSITHQIVLVIHYKFCLIDMLWVFELYYIWGSLVFCKIWKILFT